MASEFRQDVVQVDADGVSLEAGMAIPEDASGVVLFAHGSGSSRHSPRNRRVAEILHKGGLATVLLDLLTAEEERVDNVTRELRFDIPMLAERLVGATAWLQRQEATAGLDIGYFGASTGGGAALVAAARLDGDVGAVVSRGGRPDLAGAALSRVVSPTLLLVGELDQPVIGMNRRAMEQMRCQVELRIVPGATHLFEEPGKLEEVAAHSREWFLRWLGKSPRAESVARL